MTVIRISEAIDCFPDNGHDAYHAMTFNIRPRVDFKINLWPGRNSRQAPAMIEFVSRACMRPAVLVEKDFNKAVSLGEMFDPALQYLNSLARSECHSYYEKYNQISHEVSYFHGNAWGYDAIIDSSDYIDFLKRRIDPIVAQWMSPEIERPDKPKSPRRDFQAKRSRLFREMLDFGLAYVCSHPGCDERQKLTIDHIVPLSKGGTNDVGNLQFMCLRHNCSKGAKVAA